MIGVSTSGARQSIEPGVTRWSGRRLSLGELTGRGPRFTRYAAMAQLAKDGWPASHIAEAFEVSPRWVRMVLRDLDVDLFGETG